MRLVLTWLLGVPLLVGSMVLARAAFVPAPSAPPSALQSQATAGQTCSSENEQHRVAPAIAQQGNDMACGALAVKQ